MNKKVLFVTYYWPPSGGAGVQRPLKFVKYLPERGVEPYVLTVENPTYPITDSSLSGDIPEAATVFTSKTLEPFSLYSRLTGRPIEDSTKPTIRLKSDTWTARLGSWIRANVFLPDARVGWLLTARAKAQSIVEEYGIDAVVTTGPPHSVHFVGKYVQEQAGTRWIADFRDPWTGVYYNRLLPRMPFIRHLDESLERSVLKQADEAVVISDSMANIQREIYDRRYRVIPNGFDPDDFLPVDDTTETDADADGTLTIRFIGSVREGAIPNGFLKVLSGLANRLNYRVEFVGNAHPSLNDWIDKLGLDDVVRVKPYVPHPEAIRLMCRSDLLLLSINKTPGSELILTGKLFEYLGSGSPILFLGPTGGDAAKIINAAGQGVCYEHHDVRGIRRFLERFPGDKHLRSRRDRAANRNHPYSRVRLTGQLSRLITD